MNALQTLRVQLTEQLNALQSHSSQNAISVLKAQIAVNDMNWLAWLKAQQSYPQFYWRHRDNMQTVISVGKVRSFSQLNSADYFIQQHSTTLVGGLTFNGECQFYLPRLLLSAEPKSVTAYLTLDHQADPIQEQQAILAVLENLAKSTALSAVSQSIELMKQSADQTLWCGWVKKALNAIAHTDLTKVVLANETEFVTQSLNSKDFLAESEKQNAGCYHFLWAENPYTAFVGSTPERLYARNRSHLQTEALAGTAFMTADEQENQRLAQWLLNDEKNLYENQLVVDDICQNLHSFVTEINIQQVELKQLRQVQHLRRRIFAELAEQYSDQHCLMAIHPTAAVSGLPQQSAMQFLQNTENFDRSWYAGTLGFMNRQAAEFCVTIRSAFIENGEQSKIRVFAGAGIVAGSIPLLEWQEIERKAAGLVSLLQSKEIE
ncbi:isochorismate synthase [Cricetibacter osteomyelitidis]|uniref:Isochorismate synthase MenF n=1 Tax=Cricetibacter osteomyelitidis TaxID=1521931 RepID=A0A4R2T1K1_9PAST|nr:isochorismate synthase [Cricetibacter osteomyelitidis]TCP94684.1 isochorismate synthase [Cricetibacter osteomyelitidis]